MAIASAGVMAVFAFAGYGYVVDELLLRRLSAAEPESRAEAAALAGKRKIVRAIPLLIGNVLEIAKGHEGYYTTREKTAPFMEALVEIGRPALPKLIDASTGCENPGCFWVALALFRIYENEPSGGMNLLAEDFDPMHDWARLWKRIADHDEDAAVRRAALKALETAR